MSGRPFDEKAKSRLARHIIGGDKAVAKEPDEDDAMVPHRAAVGKPTPMPAPAATPVVASGAPTMLPKKSRDAMHSRFAKV